MTGNFEANKNESLRKFIAFLEPVGEIRIKDT